MSGGGRGGGGGLGFGGFFPLLLLLLFLLGVWVQARGGIRGGGDKGGRGRGSCGGWITYWRLSIPHHTAIATCARRGTCWEDGGLSTLYYILYTLRQKPTDRPPTHQHYCSSPVPYEGRMGTRTYVIKYCDGFMRMFFGRGHNACFVLREYSH